MPALKKTTVTLEEIKPITLKFLDETFKYSLGAMIAGSYATGKNNSESDIDLVIIARISEGVFIESYYFLGHKIQCIVIPFTNIDDLFRSEIANGEGIFLSMFDVGIPIKDDFGMLKKLKSKATELFKAGPRPTMQHEIRRLRSVLTTRLEDLQGNSNYDDLLFTAIDTYNRLLHFHSIYYRFWRKYSKYASVFLEDHDKDFKDEYISSFTDFVKTGSKENLNKFVEKKLDEFGGPLHFFTTRKTYEDITSD